jgi:hypothetical protein
MISEKNGTSAVQVALPPPTTIVMQSSSVSSASTSASSLPALASTTSTVSPPSTLSHRKVSVNSAENTTVSGNAAVDGRGENKGRVIGVGVGNCVIGDNAAAATDAVKYPSYFLLHISYFLSLGVIGALLLAASDGLSFLDAVFTAFSAATVTGMR